MVTYKLIILTYGFGTTEPAPTVYEYEEGTKVSVLAKPSVGWKFQKWRKDSEEHIENPIEVVMIQDWRLRCTFVEELPEPAAGTEFLDWLIRFLTNPVETAIKYTVQYPEEVIRTLNPVRVWKDALSVVAPNIKTIPPKFTPKGIASFKDVTAAAEDVKKECDMVLEAIYASLMAIEAGTLGMIDVAPDRLTQLAGFTYMHKLSEQIRTMPANAGLLQLYERQLNKQHQAKLMPAGAWAIAKQKGWITDEYFYDKMSQFGYDKESAMYQYWASERPPPLDAILELDRRGLIPKDEYDKLWKSTLMQGWIVDGVKALKWQIPEAYRLAMMVTRNQLSFKEYEDAMVDVGLNKKWADSWRKAQYTQPTYGQLAAMLWRGVIKRTEFNDTIRVSGYSPTWLKPLYELTKVIPPLPDLFDMAVKEAFVDGTWEENLALMRPWANKMGLSDEWIDRYAIAHWGRIALREMYSNLWRGYWSKDEFMRMLRIKDVHPDDREAIYNVAFLPPSIREMGYGYDMGVYDLEAITKYRRMGGLSPEDAKLSAQSLVLYRTAAELEAVRREYLWQFAHEKIGEAEFVAALKKLRTPAKAIPLWVERGLQQIIRYKKGTITEEGRLTTASEALWGFKNKLRDEKWLREALVALDWTPERIDLAVEKAKLQMIETPEPEPEVTYKKLTLSQIQAMYRRGIITDEDLPNYLIAIGYSAFHADMLRELTIPEPEPIPEAKRLSRSDIRNFYELRHISREQIVTEYEKLGYMTEDATVLALDTILSVDLPVLKARYRNRWINEEQLIEELWLMDLDIDRAIEIGETIIAKEMPERTMKERDLSASEIIKGVKVGILEAEEAVRLLEKMGYDTLEAWYKLLVNKTIDEPEKQSYWVWRKVVEAWRKASGLSWTEIPDDVIMLDTKLTAIKNEIKKERETERRELVLADLAVKQKELEVQLRRVLAMHHIES